MASRATWRGSCRVLHWSSWTRPVMLVWRLYFPVTKRAAFPCTASRFLIWVAWWVSQVQLAYSSTGRTSALYASPLVFSGQLLRFRHSRLRVPCALEIVWLTCGFKLRSLSSSTPRYGQPPSGSYLGWCIGLPSRSSCRSWEENICHHWITLAQLHNWERSLCSSLAAVSMWLFQDLTANTS